MFFLQGLRRWFLRRTKRTITLGNTGIMKIQTNVQVLLLTTIFWIFYLWLFHKNMIFFLRWTFKFCIICCKQYEIKLVIWIRFIQRGFSDLDQIQQNWVFATNSDFLISISLQPNYVVDLRVLNYEFC